ncbi:MAG: HTTM domain-containing protein, partial [bacterium]|nr:HTTM domain-containing protein [bacterium]
MLREFAHFLRERDGDYQPGDEVRVVAFCSLNGRKPQLLVDPDVDLSRQPRQSTPQPYIKPLVEPFRYEPFAAPPAEWLQHIELPQLK